MDKISILALAACFMICGWLFPFHEVRSSEDLAALWPKVEAAYRQEDNLKEGHRLLNEFIAQNPGEVTGVPEALYRITAEDCFEVFNRTWRDFAMRNWMSGRFENGMKGVCALMLELMRDELQHFLIHPDLLPKVEGAEDEKTRAVMKEAMARQRWHNRPPGSQDRSDLFNAWPDESVKRLFALERVGIVSETDPIFMDASLLYLYARLRQGRCQEAAVIFDRIVQASRNDPVWMFARARFHHWMGSPRTGKLFQELFRILNDTQADARMRMLRQQAFPYEQYGSAPFVHEAENRLAQLQPEDALDTWALIGHGQIQGEETNIDGLIGRSLAEDTILLRKDRAGGANAWEVLDDHLRRLPSESMHGLRQLQEKKCRADIRSRNPDRNSNGELRALFERFPWSETAQAGLLKLGERELKAGRSRFAEYTFEDVLRHSVHPEMRAKARVGLWVALSQSDDPARLDRAFKDVQEEQRFPWMGQTVSAGEIRKRLAQGRAAGPNPQPASPIQSLSSLQTQVVNVPAVAFWPSSRTGHDAGLGWLSTQFTESNLLVSAQNALCWYDLRDTRSPVWTQTGSMHTGGRGRYRVGACEPVIGDDSIYARYNYGALPTHLARLDTGTGSLLWGMKIGETVHSKDEAYLIGDPVLSEGLLYSIGWNKQKGAGFFLSCREADAGRLVWENELRRVGGFHPGDRNRMHDVIFGNGLTIHNDAIFSSPNGGIISRCDIRDGRLEWAYDYASADRAEKHSGGWGAAPILVGEKMICLPRDSNFIFCLDQHTGALIWKNALVVPDMALGILDDSLMVLGNSTLVSLDLSSGKTLWTISMTEEIVGRPRLIGSSLYVGTPSGLTRIDARVGIDREKRAWPDKGYDVRNFAIRGQVLYLITDEPCQKGPTYEIGQPLHAPEVASSNALTFPVERVWMIRRAKPVLHVPPPNTGLENLALVCSDNFVECIDLADRGKITWQKFVGEKPYRVLFQDQNAILFFKPWHDRFQMVALDLKTGQTAWRSKEFFGMVNEQMQFDSTLLISERNRMGAVDLRNGDERWDRIITTLGVTYGRMEKTLLGDRVHIIHERYRGGDKINWFTVNPLTGNPHGDLKTISVPGGERHQVMGQVRYGAKAGYVDVKAKQPEGHPPSVYRFDFADRSMKLFREDALIHDVQAPYILLTIHEKREDKKRVLMVLKEGDPAFEKRLEVSAERTVVFDNLLISMEADKKGFQVMDLDTGAQRFRHEEGKESSTLTWGRDAENGLYVLSHERPGDRVRITFYNLKTGRKEGSQELVSLRPKEWANRGLAHHQYNVGQHGVWMMRKNGLLLLASNDGISAYAASGGGAE